MQIRDSPTQRFLNYYYSLKSCKNNITNHTLFDYEFSNSPKSQIDSVFAFRILFIYPTNLLSVGHFFSLYYISNKQIRNWPLYGQLSYQVFQ